MPIRLLTAFSKSSRLTLGLVSLLAGTAVQAQVETALAIDPAAKPLENGSKFSAKLAVALDPGWHISSLTTPDGGPVRTEIKLAANQPFALDGKIIMPDPIRQHSEAFGVDVETYEEEVVFTLPVSVTGPVPAGTKLTVEFTYQACTSDNCLMPKTVRVTTVVPPGPDPSPKPSGKAQPTAETAADTPPDKGPAVFRDTSKTRDTRIADLISRLTLEEKAGLYGSFASGVPRLGIPPYVWWNECLHGVARSGEATVFPQAIALAATWNVDLLHTVADAISTEARAKYHDAVRRNQFLQYFGLTFWSPNINIFRDPRWGRGQETYGEDPYLTSRMGVAFVKGLQGDDPNYLKIAACAKHFAVHSGPERIRRQMDNHPTEEDFHDTYLPAFEALVKEAHVAGVMTAYNSLLGKPCAVSPVLYDLLKQWKFDGYIVSDCGAVGDLYGGYKIADDPAGALAVTAKLGLDIDCGREGLAVADAVKRGLLDERTLDARLAESLKTQMRLGMFDPPAQVPYASIPMTETASPAHSQISLEAACQAIVLLKNDGTLPLDKTKLKRVALIGPNARSTMALLGNYAGTPRFPITILAGLRAALGPNVVVECIQGCAYLEDTPNGPKDFKTTIEEPATQGFEAALAAAKRAEVVIYVGGLSADLEGEAANNGYEDFDGRDRNRIELPASQRKMLEALQTIGRPVVYVNLSGSALAFPWAAEHTNAILQAWYPGENGGTAVADVLLGNVNPAGRLPVTFYRSTADLPPFEDYAMKNRTYRFFKGTPLYPFGHGLSYTTFRYDHLKVTTTASEIRVLSVSVDVTNTGTREGDEVVQVYATVPQPSATDAHESLCAFRRVHLAPQETTTVMFSLTPAALRRWNTAKGQYAIPEGTWKIAVGASSTDIRATQSIALVGSATE